MNGLRTRLEFEDGEPIVFVLRQLIPGPRRQPEPLVKPRKVMHGRHERSLEASDTDDFEFRTGHRQSAFCPR